MGRTEKYFVILVYSAAACGAPVRVSAQISQDLPDSPSHVEEQHLPEPIDHSRRNVANFAERLASRTEGDLAVFQAIGEGKTPVPTLAIVEAAAGLIVSDPHSMPYFSITSA